MKAVMTFVVCVALVGLVHAELQPPPTVPGYTVRRAATPPKLEEGWDGPSWQRAVVLEITHWYPKDVAHRPKTQAKVQYDDEGLYVMFQVEDQYVRATRTAYQDPVCNDSCVEFFVQPVEGRGTSILK